MLNNNILEDPTPSPNGHPKSKSIFFYLTLLLGFLAVIGGSYLIYSTLFGKEENSHTNSITTHSNLDSPSPPSKDGSSKQTPSLLNTLQLPQIAYDWKHRITGFDFTQRAKKMALLKASLLLGSCFASFWGFFWHKRHTQARGAYNSAELQLKKGDNWIVVSSNSINLKKFIDWNSSLTALGITIMGIVCTVEIMWDNAEKEIKRKDWKSLAKMVFISTVINFRFVETLAQGIYLSPLKKKRAKPLCFMMLASLLLYYLDIFCSEEKASYYDQKTNTYFQTLVRELLNFTICLLVMAPLIGPYSPLMKISTKTSQGGYIPSIILAYFIGCVVGGILRYYTLPTILPQILQLQRKELKDKIETIYKKMQKIDPSIPEKRKAYETLKKAYASYKTQYENLEISYIEALLTYTQVQREALEKKLKTTKTLKNVDDSNTEKATTTATCEEQYKKHQKESLNLIHYMEVVKTTIEEAKQATEQIAPANFKEKKKHNALGKISQIHEKQYEKLCKLQNEILCV